MKAMIIIAIAIAVLYIGMMAGMIIEKRKRTNRLQRINDRLYIESMRKDIQRSSTMIRT